MRATGWRSAAACGLVLALLSAVASAHSGEVDPPPPPPPEPNYDLPPAPGSSGGGRPPRPGGGGGGPTTGGGPGKGPSTGGGARSAGVRARGRRGGATVPDWTLWWFANRRHLLTWSARAAENAPDTTPGEGDGEGALFRAEVRAALAGSLSADDVPLASSAAIALGKDGDASNAPPLLAVARDGRRERTVREAAALAIGLLEPASGSAAGAVRNGLHELAASDDEPERLRAMAIYALGLRGDQASLPLLLDISARAGATWDVPVAAITSLGLAGCEITLTDLIAYVSVSKRGRDARGRRVYAAHALARSGAMDALPVLREATLDSEADVRRAAALALGALAQSNDDETADALIRVLARDKDDGVQHAAALSLGRIGHDRAGVALRKAFLKGDGRMRPFAALALGLFARHPGHAGAAAPVAQELAARSSTETRGPLAVACGLARERAAVPTLIEIVTEDAEIHLVGHAALALGMIGDQSAVPRLREILVDTNDPLLRRETALALGMLGDVQSTAALRKQVEEESTAFAAGSAALALGRIGGTESGRALLELLRNDKRPKLARAMAAVGLGLLFDESQGARLAEIGADLDWNQQTGSVHLVLSIL